MEQREYKRYQIIGACTSMQRTTWEEEFKLMDGIVYDIDFSQDFSDTCWNGRLLNDIPVADIITAIVQPKSKYYNEPCIKEDRYSSREFWAEIDKIERKERKLEEKWEKRRKKPKDQKEGMENFERVIKEIMRE